MSTRFMERWRNPFGLILAGAAVLEGCAPFDHQPAAQEPFAVVAFVGVSDPFPDQPVVRSFDGHGVKAGREYRVQPGRHEWVYRVVDESIEETTPYAELSRKQTEKSTTTVFLSGSSSFEHSRRFRVATNVFTAEAGWRYEIMGEQMTKRFINIP